MKKPPLDSGEATALSHALPPENWARTEALHCSQHVLDWQPLVLCHGKANRSATKRQAGCHTDSEISHARLKLSHDRTLAVKGCKPPASRRRLPGDFLISSNLPASASEAYLGPRVVVVAFDNGQGRNVAIEYRCQ
jgi:hypothetical protein